MSNSIKNIKLRDKVSGWIVSIETENQDVYTDVIYTKVSREDTILKVIDNFYMSQPLQKVVRVSSKQL
ncbi:hypothetical protein OAR08_00855 [Flavobacteriaceae bacterium]|nr:hypothetical protein [Flavobacteriaceae bacterium]MDC1030939.1 hypothetical protein [Flavobacteriaceae bacterium]